VNQSNEVNRYSLGPWAQALKKIEKLEIQRAKMVAAAAAAANAAGGADNN
jgi:hypothetical protein